MKKYHIIIDGRPYKVDLIKHSEGVPFLVTINDDPREVELLNEFNPNVPFPVKMQEKIYNIELKRLDKKAPFPVIVNDTAFRVELQIPLRKVARAIGPSSSSMVARKPVARTVEEGEVISPMAGKIVSVKVKKGDSVKVDTVVCVLEAMKMENEITATKTGSVQEVRVSEGMAVNEGEVLVVIK